MIFESSLPVKRKYGENCKLNEGNVKDIYFLTECNNLNDSEITDFLEKYHSRDEILLWNSEYMNGKLDLCEQLLGRDDWGSISKISVLLCALTDIFTYEKSTYERIVDYLEKFHAAYGYFMCYPHLKETTQYPYEDKSFYPFPGIYIKRRLPLSDLERVGRSTGAEWRYLEWDGYFGLIPRLNKLKHYDLLNELFIKLIIPIFDHLFEENERMVKHNVKYRKLFQSLEEYGMREILKSYIEEREVLVPLSVKKYLRR